MKSRVNACVWLLTIVWMILSGIFVWIYWPRYESLVFFTLGDFSAIGQIVSSVTAPVAVFWIIRSFYIQQKEMSEAVEASRSQAEALARQIDLMDQNNRYQSRPFLVMAHSYASTEIPKGTLRENHIFKVKNVGNGVAFQVYIYATGFSQSGDGVSFSCDWLNISSASETIESMGKRDFHVNDRINSARKTTMILVEFHYMDIFKVKHKEFKSFSTNSGISERAMVTDLTEGEYRAMMHKHGGAIPSEVGPPPHSME